MIGLSNRVLLTVSIVVVSVGVLDSFIGNEWDLLVVLLLSLVLQTTLWLRMSAPRFPVTLRADLARWLEHHVQKTGEPFDNVLDRAVVWYRGRLFSESADEGHRHHVG